MSYVHFQYIKHMQWQMLSSHAMPVKQSAILFGLQRVIIQAPVTAAAQITVDYGGCGSALMPCDQRKQQLAATWGFDCQCELCSAPAAAVAASDARRQQMAEADALVSKAVALQDPEAAVAGKHASMPMSI
jgi:hypothetical protein